MDIVSRDLVAKQQNQEYFLLEKVPYGNKPLSQSQESKAN